MKRAFILAGGEGKRLRPFTYVIPKPLVPIGEKPILKIILESLIKYDFKTVIISVGYLGEMVESVVKSFSLPLDISFTKEKIPLGTAGALSLLKDFSDDLLVMNGDLLTSLNLKNIYDFHRKNKAAATIGIFTREVKIDLGVIKVSENFDFEDYIEKPVYNFEVSMGINVFNPRIKKYIKKNEYLDMPTLIKRLFSNKEKIICYKEKCKWLDIGREFDYNVATEEFKNNSHEYV